MSFILLESWAKKNGIKTMDAKNWARRGKIKAKRRDVKVTRWTIDDSIEPPNNTN